MNVTTEQATVYRGGDRRFFTKRAAYLSVARALIRSRWMFRFDCDCPMPGDFDETGRCSYTPDCPIHGRPERLSKIADRLARRLQSHDAVASAACWYCRHGYGIDQKNGERGHYSTVQGSTDWRPCPNLQTVTP